MKIFNLIIALFLVTTPAWAGVISYTDLDGKNLSTCLTVLKDNDYFAIVDGYQEGMPNEIVSVKNGLCFSSNYKIRIVQNVCLIESKAHENDQSWNNVVSLQGISAMPLDQAIAKLNSTSGWNFRLFKIPSKLINLPNDGKPLWAAMALLMQQTDSKSVTLSYLVFSHPTQNQPTQAVPVFKSKGPVVFLDFE